jgi:hypothetical protein
LWRVNDPKAVNQAALAIAGALSRVETFDIAWFDEEELKRRAVDLVDSLGHTRVESLKKNHVDAARLDGYRLAHVAAVLADSVISERCRRLTKDDVADLLVAAVDRKLLGLSTLPKEMQEEIERAKARRSESGG